jgi:hypothetical protein
MITLIKFKILIFTLSDAKINNLTIIIVAKRSNWNSGLLLVGGSSCIATVRMHMAFHSILPRDIP